MKERLPKLPLVIWLLFIFVFITTISVCFYAYLSPSFSLKNLFPAKILTDENGKNNITEPFKPTPKPLATGRQTYSISGSKKGTPQVSELIIDPLDPPPSGSQSATIKVLGLENQPITKVSAELITDNKTKTISLHLISGTNLEGVWQANWKIDDSYNFRYQLAIKAENASDSWVVTLTFR